MSADLSHAGEVVLTVTGDAGRYEALAARYGADGLVVVAGGGDGAVLTGRDGEPVAGFGPAVACDDPVLLRAIERELFASE